MARLVLGAWKDGIRLSCGGYGQKRLLGSLIKEFSHPTTMQCFKLSPRLKESHRYAIIPWLVFRARGYDYEAYRTDIKGVSQKRWKDVVSVEKATVSLQGTGDQGCWVPLCSKTSLKVQYSDLYRHF